MESRQLLVDIARAFFLEDRSKKEIADQWNLSRFKVARLLDQARSEGIVRIEIMDGEVRDEDLASRLARHLQLARAIVVAGSNDEGANRSALAQAAALWLRGTVREGDTFGFSWGRTLAEIGAHMDLLPPSTLVALTGVVGNDMESSPVEVLRRVAGRSRVQTMSIFAPLFVDSAATAQSLRQDPSIAQVLATYERLDLAVLSLGSWDPPVSQVLDSLSAADRAYLDSVGARAEMAGIFMDDDGRVIGGDLPGRRLSISAEQLVRTPEVVGVAGGLVKVPAIAAIARSRLLTMLVTDQSTALALLELPPVAAGPRALHVVDQDSTAARDVRPAR